MGCDTELSPRFLSYPAVKFQFNISDIFSVLMINFFVCRVDSFFLRLPTPTHTNKKHISSK